MIISAFLNLLVVSFFLVGRQTADGKKIPGWWLKVAEKQGPNACVVEEVPGTNKEFWTECRYWLNRKICGRKTRIRFECCEGFDRMDGENGCTMVKPLKNILETAEELGATKWAEYIRSSGFQSELEGAGANTFFAPTNEAFEEMSPSLRSQLDSYRGSPDNPILLYHITPSKLKSQDFMGDQIAETMHQGHHVRINKYSNGMLTVNCALVLRRDQEATNGIVHIIDRVLDPSISEGDNVADMILNDGRFQVLADMLETSGYINVLRTMRNSISILAPSDEAFQKLPQVRREKIINDREARLVLLQNHVIPHVICESAITGEHRVRTMADTKVTFNCDERGAYVETTKMREDFSLGKNGIIHTIDDVLLPDRAKNLLELAGSRQLTTFVDLVKKSGLEETLAHTGDYTFFVPNEQAWMEMPPETTAQIRSDPEYAGLMLRFHGAYGRHLTNEITDNQAIMSLDEENPVRLQVWRGALGVEDAKITEADLEAQNGVIHVVDKVIFPSNRSIEDILRSNTRYRFSTFLSILERVSGQTPPVIYLRPGSDVFYTFFVPTDDAFSRIDQDELRKWMSNIESMTSLVQNHMAVNMFPTTSFEPLLTYSVDGMSNSLKVKKNEDGQLFVNDIGVLDSYMSSNGVIHVIDDVIIPQGGYTQLTVSKTSVSTVSSKHGTTRTVTTTRRKFSSLPHYGPTTYNEESEEGDVHDSSPYYSEGRYEAEPGIDLTPGEQRSHRRTYSYSYTYGNEGREFEPGLHNEPTADVQNNPFSSSTSSASENTSRFNYTNHYYGNDVVGHEFSPVLSLSAADPSYVTTNSSSVVNVGEPVSFNFNDSTNTTGHKVQKTVTTHKRVGVTRTIYTYPSSGREFLSKATRTYSLPIDTNNVLAADPNRDGFPSPYAFTGDDRMYADGTDFAETQVSSEKGAESEEEAKISRKLEKRRRHAKRKLRRRKNRHLRGKHNLLVRENRVL